MASEEPPSKRRRTDGELQGKRFNFEDLEGQGLDTLADFLGHPVVPPETWSSKLHFGKCSQSCPCCRHAAHDTMGACPYCPANFALRAASRATKTFVKHYLSKGKPHRDPWPYFL